MVHFWRDSATETRQHSKYELVLQQPKHITLSTIKSDVTGHFSLGNNEDPVEHQRNCTKEPKECADMALCDLKGETKTFILSTMITT